MPHAFLVRSGFETKSGPLSTTISKLPPNSPYRYWSWETFLELPPFSGDPESKDPGFTSVLVCEGYAGLHMASSEAKKRGLIDGDTVTCYVATYSRDAAVKAGAEPQFKFRIDLQVHVRENGLGGSATAPIRNFTYYVGGVDFFRYFDIQLAPGVLLEADGNGHLAPSIKGQVEELGLLLTKKAAVAQACEPY